MAKQVMIAFVFCLVTVGLQAAPRPSFILPLPADEAAREIQIGVQRILENVNDAEVSRGAIIASPSRHDPEYYFHWVRDAGLTISTLLEQVPRFPALSTTIYQWSQFERGLQRETSARGLSLGEPKYHVNGQVFTGPWGRPQNDGPAIRAWAFLRAYGRTDAFVETDLEYLRQHWQDANFDLWEEVKGHHFFTRYSQMAAFYTAARVYAQNDPTRSRAYALEGQRIEDSLSAFVDNNRFLVVPTLPGSQGVQKNAGLDISTVLAPLYFGAGVRWSTSQSYVMATALRLEETFRALYPINSQYAFAPAIGRYPEDVYDGTGFSQGHPWFLATFGLAEYYCTLVEEFSRKGSIKVDRVNIDALRAVAPKLTIKAPSEISFRQTEFTLVLQGLQDKALSFIQRAVFHGGADRHYSEQFDRGSGYRRGARDLTWSYASSVRAYQRCSGSGATLAQLRSSLK